MFYLSAIFTHFLPPLSWGYGLSTHPVLCGPPRMWPSPQDYVLTTENVYLKDGFYIPQLLPDGSTVVYDVDEDKWATAVTRRIFKLAPTGVCGCAPEFVGVGPDCVSVRAVPKASLCLFLNFIRDRPWEHLSTGLYRRRSPNRRRLPSNRRRLLSNRRWLLSNRRQYPQPFHSIGVTEQFSFFFSFRC